MRIGILTFHWATNYGAILQAFCLQEWLHENGHDAEIINYKPRQFDFSWFKLLFNPRNLMQLPVKLVEHKKESLLIRFREQYLNMTPRYYKTAEMVDHSLAYDILISGSDQVLNVYFTSKGEDGKPSSAYYLAFAQGAKRRIGYALSFGCTTYPEVAKSNAAEWINCFDSISLREQSGLSVIDELNYRGPKCIVPDPTILYGAILFKRLGIKLPKKRQDYICVYMLRREIQLEGEIRYIDDKHKPLTMEEWLSTIVNAGYLVTNSYHGMIMAILAHVPFVAMLEKGDAAGMNDRFTTLLNHLNLKERMVDNLEDMRKIISQSIDFKLVDDAIIKYRKSGINYLNDEIRQR